MNWLWIGVAALFAVAAVAVFIAFQRPDFVAGLAGAAIGIAVRAAWPLLSGLLKRKTPQEEAADRKRAKRGEPSARRRPGSGGR